MHFAQTSKTTVAHCTIHTVSRYVCLHSLTSLSSWFRPGRLLSISSYHDTGNLLLLLLLLILVPLSRGGQVKAIMLLPGGWHWCVGGTSQAHKSARNITTTEWHSYPLHNSNAKNITQSCHWKIPGGWEVELEKINTSIKGDSSWYHYSWHRIPRGTLYVSLHELCVPMEVVFFFFF